MEARKPDPLGVSLALVDGDLAFTGGGDLQQVAGRENLHQGLKAIIETPFGTDLFNVGYGFDLGASLGVDLESILATELGTSRVVPQGLPLLKELVRLNLVRSLSIDDRVAEVREVVFDDEPRFFELVRNADPISSRAEHKSRRSWRVVVVLTLVTGGEAAFELSGAGA